MYCFCFASKFGLKIIMHRLWVRIIELPEGEGGGMITTYLYREAPSQGGTPTLLYTIFDKKGTHPFLLL